MSDMSFKQAKELTEQLELAELTLKQTLNKVDSATKNFNKGLTQQEKIFKLIPRTNKKLELMKILVALNVGFVVGLIVSKYFI